LRKTSARTPARTSARPKFWSGIGEIGALHPIDGPPGNGPARYYAFDGAAGSVGVISPLSHDYCDTCNRVRLSADGRLKLCLFGDHFIDLRTPVREHAGEARLIEICAARCT